MRKLELLAPARDLDAGKAAVDHGADAVYIGGPGYGARAAACNPVEDIARLAEYAHPYGVKVYAALNTLIYEEELSQAERIARELLAAGVDALIIQDPAYLMMGLPDAVFHASTQMCNTTPEKVEFLARSGFARVVLERGLTIEQVRQINRRSMVETECFVHGAICVGYSGSCYLSRSMGPRSGNRGECSQPCRMRYHLTDGSGNLLAEGKHLLSVKDLDLSARVGELIDAGVTSFKIEGRLKEISYVKNVTAWYRGVLDAEIARRPGLRRSSEGESRYGFTPDPARSFTRGFTEWTAGGPPGGAASFDTPKSLGIPVGKTVSVGRDYFVPDGKTSIAPGDGICYFIDGQLTGTNINKVEGGRVYPNKMGGIAVGTAIYRNYDHVFTRQCERGKGYRLLPVCLECTFGNGGLTLCADDGSGNRAEIFLQGNGTPAEDRQRMLAVIETQLKKAGGTIFEIYSVCFPSGIPEEIPFFTVSTLNGLRRELLAKLYEERVISFRLAHKELLRTVSRDDDFPSPAGTSRDLRNVTNSLSRRFWKMHGIRSFEPPYDLRPSLDGETVMTTPYCLRRELDMCLKDNPETPPRELCLHTGSYRYRLIFDCRDCIMRLEKEREKKNEP